jgi:CHRD domain
MKRATIVLCLLALVTASAIALPQGFSRIREALSGYQEVPALSTPGHGEFKAKIRGVGNDAEIQYELSYADTESAVQQAHIHFENATNNGPIVVFLCTNLGNGPAGTQLCPPAPATITGTITAENVGAGAAGAGIAAGELDELLDAIRVGSTYVNVHTTGRPTGEIRSQIDGNSGHEH